MKNCMFVGTSFSEAFWKDFGWVLGGKILDFRNFFDDFSKQVLKSVLEGQQIEKNERRPEAHHRFWASPAECAVPGGEIERG